MPTPHERDERAIRSLVDQVVAAIQAKDLGALHRCYAADVVSFDVEPPLRHARVDAKLGNWARVFALFRQVAYEIRDLEVVVGGDVGFGHCFGRVSGTLQDGGATPGMWVRVTFCFQKVAGGWLIVHDHASVPFDLRTGTGVTDLEP